MIDRSAVPATSDPSPTSKTFPPDTRSVRAARAFVNEVVQPCPAGDDIALVVSELAANAVLHTATPFTVSITARTDAVRVEVEDGSSQLPNLPAESQLVPTGRGLRIVQELTQARGAHQTPDGKVVWAEVRVDPIAG